MYCCPSADASQPALVLLEVELPVGLKGGDLLQIGEGNIPDRVGHLVGGHREAPLPVLGLEQNLADRFVPHLVSNFLNLVEPERCPSLLLLGHGVLNPLVENPDIDRAAIDLPDRPGRENAPGTGAESTQVKDQPGKE